jgi:hypothetical protein
MKVKKLEGIYFLSYFSFINFLKQKEIRTVIKQDVFLSFIFFLPNLFFQIISKCLFCRNFQKRKKKELQLALIKL